MPARIYDGLEELPLHKQLAARRVYPERFGSLAKEEFAALYGRTTLRRKPLPSCMEEFPIVRIDRVSHCVPTVLDLFAHNVFYGLTVSLLQSGFIFSSLGDFHIRSQAILLDIYQGGNNPTSILRHGHHRVFVMSHILFEKTLPAMISREPEPYFSGVQDGWRDVTYPFADLLRTWE
jgi:hypothetical protein